MTMETEAGADALTGAILAGTVERKSDAAARTDVSEADTKCRNCGASLTGAYCAACGQSAHIHRSCISLGHDILHSVFHFEGKLWRTLPELIIHPGRLTRRYVDGERAKFISPMALFLFTVFLMYAVFSITGGNPLGGGVEIPELDVSPTAIAAMEQEIADLREQLRDTALPAQERASIERELADLESSIAALEALASGDWERVGELEGQSAARANDTPPEPAAEPSRSEFQNVVSRAVKELNDNPSLLAYKLKTNGYKFSWALVPLSIPFMWLLFFWRRDIHVYDHAVFVTYSISFMMLLLIGFSFIADASAVSRFVPTILMIVSSVHMYRQLRGAYALSRRGALVRLFFLLISAAIVLATFFVALLLIGALD